MAQLDLLTWQPPPELMQSAEAKPLPEHSFKVGDGVMVDGVEGRVYYVDAGLWVSIGNTAKPYEPSQVRPWKPNPHAIAWHQGQVDLYTRLMNRFMEKAIQRPEVAFYRAEIRRLAALREQATNKLQKLKGE